MYLMVGEELILAVSNVNGASVFDRANMAS